MSSSANTVNKEKSILTLGKGSVQGLDERLLSADIQLEVALKKLNLMVIFIILEWIMIQLMLIILKTFINI